MSDNQSKEIPSQETTQNQTPQKSQTASSTHSSDLEELRAIYVRLQKVFGDVKPDEEFEGDDEDAHFYYDLKLVSKDGVEARVRGRGTLSAFFMPECLPETPERFQTLFLTHVFKPLRAKVNRLIARVAEEQENGNRLLEASDDPGMLMIEGDPTNDEQITEQISEPGATPPTGVPDARGS